MTIHNLEPFIAEHAFFAGLSPAYITLIAGCAKNVVYDAGAFVFKQGETAEWFYVVRDGHVAVEVPAPSGGSVRVATVERDEILGWSWLMPPYVYQFDARALDKTRAVAIDGHCLRKKCDDDPALGYELMKRFSQVMTERLQAARLQLLDVYGKPQTEDTINDG